MKYTAKNILVAAMQVSLLVMTTDLIAQNVAPVPMPLQPVGSYDPKTDWVTKFLELKNVDAVAMKSILDIFRADIAVPSAVGGRYRIISVRAPKEIMPAIEDTIARFDVPPPPPPAMPPIKSFEVSVQVVGAYDGTAPAPNCPTCSIPTSLQPVITQLQKNFTYKTYMLLDSQLYRQTGGTSLSSVNSLAGMSDSAATYSISWSQANATSDNASIRLYSLKFGADVWVTGRSQSTHFGFDTSQVQIPPDQQVVIGKTTVGTATVFLVVRAKVVD